MSLEAMVWALKHADAPDPLSHLVLIGLADHATSSGDAAWPPIDMLAQYARCSRRSVQNRLRLLESLGLIRRGDQRMVGHIPGNRRPVVYDLNLDRWPVDNSADSGDLGVQEVHPSGPGDAPEDARGARPYQQGCTAVPTGVHAVAYKPSLTVLNRPSSSSSILDDGDEAAPGASVDNSGAAQVATPESVREDVALVVKTFADAVEGLGVKRPDEGKRAQDQARLMLDRDGRPLDHVLWLIRWTVRDPFWSSNVLSLTKFRAKYDQLKLQAKRPRAAVDHGGDVLRAEAERLAAIDGSGLAPARGMVANFEPGPALELEAGDDFDGLDWFRDGGQA